MALDKLVDSSQLDADLLSIANAIRNKTGDAGDLTFPAGFLAAIEAIESEAEASTVHVTVEEETNLRALLANYPIPLKYRDEMVLARFYSDAAPSTGGVFNWVLFFIQNLSKNGMLTNYKTANGAANGMGLFNTISGSNSTYYGLSDYAITNSSTTNNARLIAAGTVVKVLHIPFNWSTFSCETVEL